MSERDRADPRDGQRDAPLERAWRKGSTEQPSSRLDAAILAAAREAVGDRNETPVAAPVHVRPRQRWNQWAPLAAAAAVAGLALTLVQTLPRDPERAPTPTVQESATVAAPADAPSPVAQEQESAPGPMAAPQVVPASPAARMPAAIPAEGTVGPTAAAPQAPAAGSYESRADSNAARSKAVGAAMAEQAAVADDWVERITVLYAAGDIAAAEDALRAFRAAEPDADRHLPEQLREWAGSVR